MKNASKHTNLQKTKGKNKKQYLMIVPESKTLADKKEYHNHHPQVLTCSKGIASAKVLHCTKNDHFD
jgi:hypothetical protein